MTNYAKFYASTISIKAFSRLRQQKKKNTALTR